MEPSFFIAAEGGSMVCARKSSFPFISKATDVSGGQAGFPNINNETAYLKLGERLLLFSSHLTSKGPLVKKEDHYEEQFDLLHSMMEYYRCERVVVLGGADVNHDVGDSVFALKLPKGQYTVNKTRTFMQEQFRKACSTDKSCKDFIFLNTLPNSIAKAGMTEAEVMGDQDNPPPNENMPTDHFMVKACVSHYLLFSDDVLKN
jgi:hypothetical protein